MKMNLRNNVRRLTEHISKSFSRETKNGATAFEPAPSYWAMIPVLINKPNHKKGSSFKKH
jgi:hypothetical protein